MEKIWKDFSLSNKRDAFGWLVPMFNSPLLMINMALLLLVRVLGTSLRRVMYMALPREVPQPPDFLIPPIFFITLSDGDAKFMKVYGLLLYETTAIRISPRLWTRNDAKVKTQMAWKGFTYWCNYTISLFDHNFPCNCSYQDDELYQSAPCAPMLEL